MLFAEVSDIVQIATLVTTLLGGMFAAWIGLQIARIKAGQTTAANKAEVVAVNAGKAAENAERAVVKADENSVLTQSVHRIVNGERVVLLEHNAMMAKRIADLTGEDGDKTQAIVAARLVSDHKTMLSKQTAPTP